MTIDLEIQRHYDEKPTPSDTDFAKWVNLAFSDPDNEFEITLRTVDEEEGAHLNKILLNKTGPTNVLSIPADLPPDLNINLLGDIALCAPVVEREAKEQNKTSEQHWAHLTIHAVLHLLGYDHQTDEDADVMENLETQLLAKLGYPDPYDHLEEN